MTRPSIWIRFAFLPAMLVLVLTFAATGIGPAQDTTTNPCGPMDGTGADTPMIIAVKFHADWCGYCKTMGPVFEELQAKFDREPVLYVTFDQTREFNRKQAKYLAHAMDLDSVWKENGGKTGFILLIDTKTHEVVQRLSHEQTIKQMGTAIQEAVKAAS